MGRPAGVVEGLTPIEFQKAIQSLGPVPHGHGDMSAGLIFRAIQVHSHKLLRQHGLPHIRFHELRHSCASLLINEGFTLKDVQEWMGHADIKMTANIYGHLDVARKQSMAEKLAGSLSG